MTPMTSLPAHDDGWTVNDLYAIPEDGLRYELGLRLKVALDAADGDGWRIGCNPGVSMGPRNYREPDLVVFHRRAVHKKLADAEAGDVLLVAES